MNQRTKPTVGMKLFVKRIGRWNRDDGLEPAQVVKVGRKYFSVRIDGSSPHFDTSHHIESWSEVTEYQANTRLYLTEQEEQDEREMATLQDVIWSAFQYRSNTCNFGLEGLRQIAAIIEQSKNGGAK